MDSQTLLARVLDLVPLVLSLTVHEYAHAWSAFRLGDDTALRQGRLTLNPLVHLDPLGTVLLPLLGVPFGWAKPVPVNPVQFRRDVSMTRGMMLTAAAGPLSNLLLAVVCAVLLGLGLRFASAGGRVPPAVLQLLVAGLQMNVALAVFNLLPLPPLDGSRIVEALLPMSLRPAWDKLQAAGPVLLLVAVALGGRWLAGPNGFLGGLLFQLSAAMTGKPLSSSFSD